MIVILSYNHPQITARCVSSALSQLPANQVVLFHNGSETRHQQVLRDQFPQVTHWYVDENRGYSGGVNEALRRAFEISKWVFLLTNDTEIIHWRLSVDQLSAGIYSPRVWLRKQGRLDYVGGLFDSSNAQLVHLKEPKTREDLGKGQYLYVPGTAFLLEKSVYGRVGPLDESLHTYWEDVDFGARATKLGIHFGYLPEIEIIHQGRKTTGKDSFYTNYLFKRNRQLVSRRHCPAGQSSLHCFSDFEVSK